MEALKWKLRCTEDKEGCRQEMEAEFSILRVQIQHQVFFFKRLIIAKLHSNKTTPNGLGRINYLVLRLLAG
jgi:hypothetical protein